MLNDLNASATASDSNAPPQPIILRRLLGLPIIVASILLSLWAGVLWSARVTEKLGNEDIRRETRALALLFSTHVDTTFRTLDLGLKELRGEWLREGHASRQLGQLANMHAELLPGAFVQTGITDAKGNVVFTMPVSMAEPVNVADRDYFKAQQGASEDALFVGRPIFGRISGKWSIPMSRPVYRNGKFDGVVYVTADPDYFIRFYWLADIGRDGVATMVRDSGEVMARSSELEKFIGQRISHLPFADPHAPLQGGFMQSAQSDGVERFYGYARLPRYGLSVLIGPSVSGGLRTVHSMQRQEAKAAGFLTLLVLIVGALLHYSFRRETRAKVALAESETRFGSIFANMLEGVALAELVLDPEGRPLNFRFLQINPAFERQTGLNRDAVVGRLATEVYGAAQAPRLDVYARVALGGVAESFELRFEELSKDFVVQVVSPKRGYFAIVLDDVTERKRLQQEHEQDHAALQEQYRIITKLHAQLQEQVIHDPLTDLHNRRYLDEMAPREVARARREGYPTAFMMFDIDNFKSINDTYGHGVGDRVLTATANALQRNARESDLVFRFGGEEFLMVLPNMDAQQALIKANACRHAVSETKIGDKGAEIRVTISVGVAIFPDDGNEVEALIAKADEALYAAKRNGRDRVVLAAAANR